MLMRARRRGSALVGLLTAYACALVLPVAGFVLYSSSGRDDAYITYWAAQSLAGHGSISNYNGAPVEQSSSLLETVLLAVLNRVTTLPIPVLGLVLGVGAGMLAAVLAGQLARQIDPQAEWLTVLLTATSAYLVYWSFGGLESSLTAACLLVLLLTFARVRGRAGLAAHLAACVAFLSVRPESGFVLAAAAAAWLLLARRAGWATGRGWWTLGAALIGSAGLALFRLAYFGSPMPQPVWAKTGGVHLHAGWDYLVQWGAHLWAAPLLLAVAAGVWWVRRSPLGSLAVLTAAAELGFVLLAGGDWMEAGRFLVPVLPLLALLAAISAAHLGLPTRRAAAATLVGLNIFGMVWVAADWSTGTPAWSSVNAAGPWYERTNRVHVRDARFLPVLERTVDRLAAVHPGPVTLATRQAGMVPFYLMTTRQHTVRLVDMANLSTDDFRCTSGMVKSASGADVSLRYWLGHIQECGVPAPDVVYGLHTFSGPADAYVVVCRQPPSQLFAHSRLRGGAVDAGQYVAVRRSLASTAGLGRC